MTMVRYVLGRVAQAILVVWAAYTVTFLIVYALPGDPVSVMLAGASGDGGYVSPEARAELESSLGLDRPLPERYLHSLAGLLRGDLGTSVTSGVPVADLLTQALPSTLALGAVAILVAVVVATVLALLSGLSRAGWLRELLLGLPPLAASAPTFWIGLLLVQVVSFRLGLLPAIGDTGWQSLVLPALTLAVPASAALAQVASRSLRTAQQEPHVLTARSKGVGRLRALTRHAGRGAAVAPLTVLGLALANVVAGAVVVETVFARRGIGRVTANAVTAQDLPVVLGVVLVIAVVFVTVNLLTDLLLPLVDPRLVTRVRAEGAPG